MFKYTFNTIADIKKFSILVLILSILTLIEPFPFLGITATIFEKIILFSNGVFLIYLLKNTNSIEEYYEFLRKNNIFTSLFHFIPTAIGIVLGIIILGIFWIAFFIIILKFTNSLYIIATPNVLSSLANTSYLTKILIGFFLIYFLFFSYVFLGKLGASLEKENFKEAFLTIISTMFDFNYWIKTFNKRYFLIYIIWSFLSIIIYFLTLLAFVLLIYPTIVNNPNITLFLILLLNASYVIIAYFTFFSSYFANSTI